MAESAALIRSESARRAVNGRGGRWGVVLLYPDRLASVGSYTEYAFWFLTILILDIVAYHIFRDITSWLAPAFGVLLGGLFGRTGALQASIASALAELGRDVRATPAGLPVLPRAVANGA